MAVCAVVALVAGLAATLRASDGRDAPAPRSAAPDVIVRGALAVNLPAGWRQQRDAATLPDLRLSDRVALADPATGVRLVAGFATGESETLLPKRFIEAVGRPLPRAQPVVMESGLEGVHYFGLSPESGGLLLDVYVAPTSEGILTAACIARRVGSLLDSCFKGVAGITLKRGQPLPFGRDAAFRDALRAEVAELEAADAIARRRLAEAATARDQVRVLEELRATYNDAARALATLVPRSVEWPRRILRSLGRTSSAYERLEMSIAGAGGYGRARAQVLERRAELRRLLDRVLNPPA